mmetsp:Transcript_15322/g.31153  ORF Transcript_15322/g.31153 Transcript_15322/m.31153 type:complete len:204 (-) Transcript_15322:191-802(-)
MPSFAWDSIIVFMPSEPKSCMSVKNSKRRCLCWVVVPAPLQMPTAASMPACRVVPPPAIKPLMLVWSALLSRSRADCKGWMTVPVELNVAKPKRSSSRSWAKSPSSASFASCSRLRWAPAALRPATPPLMEPDTSSTATTSMGVASRGQPSRQDLRKHPTQTSPSTASAPKPAGTRALRAATATTALRSGSPVWYVCWLKRPW